MMAAPAEATLVDPRTLAPGDRAAATAANVALAYASRGALEHALAAGHAASLPGLLLEALGPVPSLWEIRHVLAGSAPGAVRLAVQDAFGRGANFELPSGRETISAAARPSEAAVAGLRRPDSRLMLSAAGLRRASVAVAAAGHGLVTAQMRTARAAAEADSDWPLAARLTDALAALRPPVPDFIAIDTFIELEAVAIPAPLSLLPAAPGAAELAPGLRADRFFYADPRGAVHGPYGLAALRGWRATSLPGNLLVWCAPELGGQAAPLDAWLAASAATAPGLYAGPYDPPAGALQWAAGEDWGARQAAAQQLHPGPWMGPQAWPSDRGRSRSPGWPQQDPPGRYRSRSRSRERGAAAQLGPRGPYPKGEYSPFGIANASHLKGLGAILATPEGLRVVSDCLGGHVKYECGAPGQPMLGGVIQGRLLIADVPGSIDVMIRVIRDGRTRRLRGPGSGGGGSGGGGRQGDPNRHDQPDPAALDLLREILTDAQRAGRGRGQRR